MAEIRSECVATAVLFVILGFIASGEAVKCYTRDFCTGQTFEVYSSRECCLEVGKSYKTMEGHCSQCGLTGEINCAPDTIIEDPLYTVPLKINNADLREISPQLASEITPDNPLSLCYEVHGNPNKYYNLVSSECVTVNARYNEAHNIDQIVIYNVFMVTDVISHCQEIVVNEDCSYGPTTGSWGIDIARAESRLSLTVSNCMDKELFIEIDCTTKPLHFQVIRGLDSNHENTHGLLGQFWNNPVRLLKFDGEHYDDYDTSDHYVIEIGNVGPKGPSFGQRQITGHLKKMKWSGAPGYCLYVGNCNAGPMHGVKSQNDPVIKGELSDYEVKPRVNKENLGAYFFNQFDYARCTLSGK